MSIKTKTLEIAELTDYVTAIAQITCEKCNKMEEGSIDVDIFDALDYFYSEGWKIKNGKCLCKECLNKP